MNQIFRGKYFCYIWSFDASSSGGPVASDWLPNDPARVEVFVHLLLVSPRSTDDLAVLVRACLPVQQVVALVERCEKVTVLDALLQAPHVELLVGWRVVAEVVGVVPAPQLYAG